MSSGQDLFNHLQDVLNKMDKALGLMGKRAEEMAKTDADYRIAKAERIIELRREGYPVTIILDLAKGDKEIAKYKTMSIIAEASFKSCLEAINIYKLQAKSLEAQIDREWNRK